jgi:GTPase SAR1 family protein
MKKTSLYPEIDYKFVILGNYGNGKTSYLIRLALD